MIVLIFMDAIPLVILTTPRKVNQRVKASIPIYIEIIVLGSFSVVFLYWAMIANLGYGYVNPIVDKYIEDTEIEFGKSW